jgi:hypothetical protein
LVLLSTGERLVLCCSLRVRDFGLYCSRLVRDLCCSLRVRDFGLYCSRLVRDLCCSLRVRDFGLHAVQRARLVRACVVVVPLDW